jgi:hypothetical protein
MTNIITTKDSLTQRLAQQLWNVYRMDGKLGFDLDRKWACIAVNRTIELVKFHANEGCALTPPKPPYDPEEVIADAEKIASSLLQNK